MVMFDHYVYWYIFEIIGGRWKSNFHVDAPECNQVLICFNKGCLGLYYCFYYNTLKGGKNRMINHLGKSSCQDTCCDRHS